MENFIITSIVHPWISIVLLKLVSFFNQFNNLCIWIFKNEVIDGYMHFIMQNLNKNAQVCKYSPPDQKIGQCLDMVLFKGKRGDKGLKI